jgi:hypothetical protein
MNEPAAFILWGDRSLPKVTQHFMEGRGGDHREAHNVYGLLQGQANSRGIMLSLTKLSKCISTVSSYNKLG